MKDSALFPFFSFKFSPIPGNSPTKGNQFSISFCFFLSYAPPCLFPFLPNGGEALSNQSISALLRCIVPLLSLLALLVCGPFLLSWTFPFLIAWLLSSLLQPPIRWISRHTHLRRKAASSLVTFCLILLFLSLVSLLLWRLVAELVHALSSLPGWLADEGPAVMEAISGKLNALFSRFPPGWSNQLHDLAEQLFSGLQTELASFSAKLIDWAARFARGLPSFFLSFFVSLISTFFMAMEYDAIRSFLSSHLPERCTAFLNGAGKTLRRTAGRLLQSYLLLMVITFGILTVGLVLLRVQDALLLLDLIAVVVHNLLEPRILGSRLGIHPLATLMAMYLGFRIFGVWGMALFPLLLLLVKDARAAGLLSMEQIKKEQR